MSGLIIDGKEYNVFITSVERSFEVSDSDSSGRTKDWKMHRDVIGTFYNYTIEIELYGSNYDDYYRCYDVLSSPISQHRITVPYNDTTITYDAYVTKGKDKPVYVNGKWVWSGLSCNFIAMEPQKRA